jgi:hypothetical protein
MVRDRLPTRFTGTLAAAAGLRPPMLGPRTRVGAPASTARVSAGPPMVLPQPA